MKINIYEKETNVFLVKDADKDVFLWEIRTEELDSGLQISMNPLLKGQSQKQKFEIQKAFIEYLIKENKGWKL